MQTKWKFNEKIKNKRKLSNLTFYQYNTVMCRVHRWPHHIDIKIIVCFSADKMKWQKSTAKFNCKLFDSSKSRQTIKSLVLAHMQLYHCSLVSFYFYLHLNWVSNCFLLSNTVDLICLIHFWNDSFSVFFFSFETFNLKIENVLTLSSQPSNSKKILLFIIHECD